jgi:hypothetical protein
VVRAAAISLLGRMRHALEALSVQRKDTESDTFLASKKLNRIRLDLFPKEGMVPRVADEVGMVLGAAYRRPLIRVISRGEVDGGARREAHRDLAIRRSSAALRVRQSALALSLCFPIALGVSRYGRTRWLP